MKLLEQQIKEANEDEVKTFKIKTDDNTGFNIKAVLKMTVFQFKRIILTELKGKPFFFAKENCDNN